MTAPIESRVRGLVARRSGWRLSLQHHPSEPEASYLVAVPGAPLHAAGWKLHLAAIEEDAAELLSRCLPALVERSVAFKVLTSLAYVGRLNSDHANPSQAGKLVTVYPRGDEHALRLADVLHELSADLRSPPILSDKRFRVGSSVHCRWGGIRASYLQTLAGEIAPFVVREGRKVPDRRVPRFVEPPAGTLDIAPEGVVATPSRGARIGDRYVVVRMLARGLRGWTALGLDTAELMPCVLKVAHANALVDAEGRDARDRLRHEAAMLARLSGAPVPGVLAGPLELPAGDLLLVLEDLSGPTMEESLDRMRAVGSLPRGTELERWGRLLLRPLLEIHDRGVTHRDLKPSNIVVGAGGAMLLDLELAHAGGEAPFRGGTVGFADPAQLAGAPPDPRDDVYGWGALLFAVATGISPAMIPAERRGAFLRSVGPRSRLVELAARCLSTDPGRRPGSVEELEGDLGSCATPITPPSDRPFVPLRVATDLAHHLLRFLRSDGALPWKPPLLHGRVPLHDLRGTAGAVLALAELVPLVDDEDLREGLREGVRTLTHAAPTLVDPGAGLYVGETGVVLSLLAASEVLYESASRNEALARWHRQHAVPHHAPDLHHGSAGRLRGALAVHALTGEPSALVEAECAVDYLLQSVFEVAGGPFWPRPTRDATRDDPELNDEEPFVGYSHGSAGIIDALLDYLEVARSDEVVELVGREVEWLEAHAMPIAGGAVAWPRHPTGEYPNPAFWCHGAAGVARFLMRAARFVPVRGGLVDAALLATARGALWAESHLCHGLAGNLDIVLDAPNPELQTGLVRHLASWLEESERLAESMGLYRPDFLRGLPGLICTLVRLHDPSRPHALAVEAFRRWA